jgi:hypothetical protein
MNDRMTEEELQARLRNLHGSVTLSQKDARALESLSRTGVFAPTSQTPRRGTSRRNLLLQVAGGVATVAVGGAVAVAILLSHGHLRQNPVPQSNGIEQALSAGAPAAIGPTPARSFVWLTGVITDPPQPSGGQSARITGTSVAVVDWSGVVRYRFQLPHPAAGDVPTGIQAISTDGTRALLDDGTVLDQTGAVVGKIPLLKMPGQPGNSMRWMSDGKHVCAATSNEPVAPYVAPAPKGQPNPSPLPVPPYARAGADHSLTLKVFGLDGSVRTVATVGSGPLGVGSGFFGDSVGVLACNPTTDLAVVARYHDADTSAAGRQSSTNMTVSLWAIKLSTGAVLFHTPETRMALGRAFFFGSENGRLAVQFLWNSKVWGSETDVVLEMPSGRVVPVLDAEASSDTPGLSSDGTRILRRVVNLGGTTTELKLIDASDGRVIRRVTIPGIHGATAVALPGGSAFMLQVENYLALVDGNGGVTLLHPDVTLSGPGNTGPGGVGLTWSGVQG